jgi:hypothetical protein
MGHIGQVSNLPPEPNPDESELLVRELAADGMNPERSRRFQRVLGFDPPEPGGGGRGIVPCCINAYYGNPCVHKREDDDA